MKVHVLRFNECITAASSPVLKLVFLFRGNLGDQVKGRSPKKLKLLIEVPYVLRVIVNVLRFYMIPVSSRLRVPRPSYPFW